MRHKSDIPVKTETKFISLNSDRKLAYAEYGDPLGQPVFFFHCIPGSRLFCSSSEVSINMGHYVASQIPNCRAAFCESEGHLLLFTHWEEVLNRLTGNS